jgi:hypothetical protein
VDSGKPGVLRIVLSVGGLVHQRETAGLEGIGRMGGLALSDFLCIAMAGTA